MSPQQDTEELFYVEDGHSGVRQLVDENGMVTESYSYDAYGNLLGSTGTSENDYLYRGEQFDDDLDLQYLRARYYDPTTGRFISTDPFEGHLEQPVSRHRYLYGNSNPVMNLDPSGMVTLTELNGVQLLNEIIFNTFAAGQVVSGAFSGVGRVLRKITSDMILRKLGNYSRKNRLYRAFRELGRVIRTIFLLRFISNSELRQKITAATNKVEAYHGFSKWFFFGGDRIIATNDVEQQEKIIKYNDLIANAVIFQNVVDLTDLLQQLQREGYLLAREDVAFLSPYLTRHIKRFGDYTIDMETTPRALDEGMAIVL